MRRTPHRRRHHRCRRRCAITSRTQHINTITCTPRLSLPRSLTPPLTPAGRHLPPRQLLGAAVTANHNYLACSHFHLNDDTEPSRLGHQQRCFHSRPLAPRRRHAPRALSDRPAEKELLLRSNHSTDISRKNAKRVRFASLCCER